MSFTETSIASYIQAKALMQLIGDDPTARRRMYKSLSPRERKLVWTRMGVWFRGHRTMGRFDQSRLLWVHAMALVMEYRYELESMSHMQEEKATG